MFGHVTLSRFMIAFINRCVRRAFSIDTKHTIVEFCNLNTFSLQVPLNGNCEAFKHFIGFQLLTKFTKMHSIFRIVYGRNSFQITQSCCDNHHSQTLHSTQLSHSVRNVILRRGIVASIKCIGLIVWRPRRRHCRRRYVKCRTLEAIV